ncbi:hypothetical protein GCM10027020_31460 [Nocardioides salsibiostraticola]
MSKLSLLAAGSIGFLLGSRAGHAPYEKAAETAKRVRSNPKVDQGVEQAKAAAAEKASEAASTAKAKVTDLTSGGSNPDLPAGYGDDAAPQGAI